MVNRRELIKILGLASVPAIFPDITRAGTAIPPGPFRFCLNTSTISGQKAGLAAYIDIASKAGYQGVEIWMPDVEEYLKSGKSTRSLADLLASKKIVAENAISFTSWMVDDDTARKSGLAQLEEEMKILSAIGCRRIAAPPAGMEKGDPIDFQKAGARYRDILELGRKYKVIPQLEFWGGSGTLYNLGQALAIAAAANDADARILPDVYHLFRGGSGFEGLKLLNGRAIEIIHINDYPGNKPAEEQNDSDRVYPGDGVAPVKQVLRDLKAIGGTKVLSLELFNKSYWAQDALQVARTGLEKMRTLVKDI